MKRYGFYSEEDRNTGTFWYLTPSGKQVEVTHVSSDPQSIFFRDKGCVGEVTKFIRVGVATQNYIDEIDWTKIKEWHPQENENVTREAKATV